jgi:uncharacterized protein
VLDVIQDLSGIGVGIIAFAAFGPAVGALVTWAVYRGMLGQLLPERVSRRQSTAHFILGVVAAILLVGIAFGVFLMAQATPDFRATAAGIPIGVAVLGAVIAAALQEVGLRGIAQPLLELTGSRLLATIIVGLLWGFWIVQMYSVENTVLTIAAVMVSALAFSMLLGYVGNGSVVQRVAASTVVHGVVAAAVTFVTGADALSELVAIALAVGTVITTAIFLALFVAARRKRALRRAAGE